MKLRTKILLSSFLIIVTLSFVFLIISMSTTNTVFERYEKMVQHHIDDQMQKTLAHYYVANNGSWRGVQQQFMPFSPRDRGNYRRPAMVLFDHNEEVVAAWPRGTEERWADVDFKTFGLTLPIEVEDKVVGTLWLPSQNIMNLDGIKVKVLSTIMASFLFAILISSLLAFAISFLLANRLTRPLHQLAVATEQIKQRHFDLRLPIPSQDEVGKVVQAFNEMNEELQRSEQVRKNMLADVAHELRTPLTVMQGQLESIQQGLIPATVENILPINDEVIRLNRLIDDLRQLTLAESGALPLRKIKTNLRERINQIIDIFSVEFEIKGLTVELESPQEKEPVSLTVDPDRITQVMVNLLSNALEHSPPKSKITITFFWTSLPNLQDQQALEKKVQKWLRKESMEENQSSSMAGHKGLVIAIVDEGPGIEDDHLPHIFDRFYRCDSSRGRQRGGGSGLGLAIAKEFVLAHQGMITVLKGEYKGTCFAIFLPQLEEELGKS
ncbi:HAMP domain-containing protein [Heliorestis acidaminivorans]|uniref:histidine kinase n=1 Tax=Heliorestis acidaminivorans TaxID=553427 RepID=A0A6I0F097_9FIRM|nr:ATP-binding protein [Heliorestis acidaminivorans]KAB2953276.1 HAMP domain-containing protein [Heliorestis acidaminivorans]